MLARPQASILTDCKHGGGVRQLLPGARFVRAEGLQLKSSLCSAAKAADNDKIAADEAESTRIFGEAPLSSP